MCTWLALPVHRHGLKSCSPGISPSRQIRQDTELMLSFNETFRSVSTDTDVFRDVVTKWLLQSPSEILRSRPSDSEVFREEEDALIGPEMSWREIFRPLAKGNEDFRGGESNSLLEHSLRESFRFVPENAEVLTAVESRGLKGNDVTEFASKMFRVISAAHACRPMLV